MSTQWLAVQSFQQNQALLDAINTLSIHIKLKLSSIADEGREKKVQKAKKELASFFSDFEKLVKKTEQGKVTAILGVNPRLRQLAKSFVAAKQDKQRFRSDLKKKSLSHLNTLLNSTDKNDQKALLECLSELRVLIEEHLYTDTTQILGEF